MPLSTSITFDENDVYNWFSIETTIITEIGHVFSRIITYDDGSIKEQEFDETGALSYMFQSDPNNAFAWETIETIYDYASSSLSERVIVYDNGNTTEQTFNAGVITNSLLVDNGDDYDWSWIDSSYDQNGQISERELLYDNGVFTTQLFDAGTITFSLSVDVDDFYSDAWDVVTLFYSDGELSERQTRYDNGSFKVEVFADGTLSETVQIDDYFGAGNAYDWSRIDTTYDQSGLIQYRETVFDNGVMKYEEFENGIRTEMTQLDGFSYSEEPLDGGANAWQQIYTAYDQSSLIEYRETVFDNGVLKYEEFENGTRTEMTQLDGFYNGEPPVDGGAEAWESIVTYFEEGDIARRETLFDDGVAKLELFENGVRTVVYQDDPDDGQGGARDWQEKLTNYDANGQIETAGTLFDDGDTIIFNYEDGERTERVRFDGDDDESWLLSVTSFSDEGNQTVNYDTVDEVPEAYLGYLGLVYVSDFA